MGRKEDDLRFKNLSKYRVKCKCSHTIIITRVDRVICNHCGNWVYKTPELKFKYEMKKMLGKENKNDNKIR